MNMVKKEYRELLSILDEIFNYLVNKTDNYKVNFFKMSEDVFNLKKKEVENKKSTATDFKDLVSEIFSNFDAPYNKTNDLRLATIHLYNEGLVNIDSNHNIEITFKGLLSYTEGVVNKWDSDMTFSQRLQNIQAEQIRQNSTVSRYTMWIMIGALVASLYYLIEISKIFFVCVSH
jgi:hypothetical protein